MERFARAKKKVAEIQRLTLCAEGAGTEAGEAAGAGQMQDMGKMRDCLRAIRKLSCELLEEL